MKAPDKIYLLKVELEERWPGITEASELEPKKEVCYIRKDALLEWIKSEMERLWELLPDADNPDPTQMELRYLGQYMQMEALEDKLNSM